MSIPAQGAWLEVPRGMPLSAVSIDLADRGLLAHPRLLTLYGRATGDATRVRAGEYQLEAGTTPASLMTKLVSGEVYLHQLTVVEGWRFSEFLAALRAHPAIAAGTLTGSEIMAELGEPGVHPEGQFFPETYRFPRETPEIEVLRAARRALQERLDSVWQNRRAEMQLHTPYEALILASIIEKETA
ncbi:MAG TPA: endolytic transglycosylase MltG, partial [Gammaproteobacteria bacterium]|nr:endolytic transglycosylase MltG [Gammaproteobacteria bacterium]